MATPDERINEAQAAIESSLRQSFKTGMSEVEQAFHAAEQEGEQIVGDPATTRPDELPPQYRPNTAVLTLADLISWGIPEATIVDYAQQGLLGQEYMSWAPSTLREHVMMAGKQLQRQAMIDAGKYAGKTVADPILEAYWEGKAPHPKTKQYVRCISHIAPVTCVVGINGRLWAFEKGVLYPRVPMEVVRILVEKAAALKQLDLYINLYSTMGTVPLLQKVAQQGGMTDAGVWANQYLAPVGGPQMTVNTVAGMFGGGHVPGTI